MAKLGLYTHPNGWQFTVASTKGKSGRRGAPVAAKRFGQFTAVGAGALPVSEADGVYGEFTVAGGIATPNTSPLTVGATTIGGTDVSVIAAEASVASIAEFTAARTAMGTAGGRTLRFRAGVYAPTSPFFFATANYASPVVIAGEGDPAAENWLTRFDAEVGWNGCQNVTVEAIEINSPSARTAGFNWSGPTQNCTVQDCYIHQTQVDPFGDYTVAGSYPNKAYAIRGISSGGLPVGMIARRNKVRWCERGIIMGFGGAGDVIITDNDVAETYSDTYTLTLVAAQANNLIHIERNAGWNPVGDPADGSQPHVDGIQFIGTTNNNGIRFTGLRMVQNLFFTTDDVRGKSMQGIFSGDDSGNRPIFEDAVVAGNIAVVDSAWYMSLKHDGGILDRNLILAHPRIATTVQPNALAVIKSDFIGPKTTLVTGNVYETAPNGLQTAVTLQDNVLLGHRGATIPYTDALAGPLWPTSPAEAIAAYAAKIGGPLLATAPGAGPIGTGATWGAIRNPAGWSFVVNDGTAVSALTIADMLTATPHDDQFTLSGTFTGPDSSALEYRIADATTDATVKDWTGFTAGTGGVWSVEATSPRYDGMVKASVRGGTASALQATAFRVGMVPALVGQSLAIRAFTQTFSLSFTPPADRLWWMPNSVNGGPASAPIAVTGSSNLGLRRAAAVLAKYGAPPMTILDLTHSGTSRSEWVNAEEVADRSWIETGQNPVNAIRALGVEPSIHFEAWYTSDAGTFQEWERHWSPSWLGLQDGGIGDTDNGTGITDYVSGQVQVVASRFYTPAHWLWDKSAAGNRGLWTDYTKWVPFTGAAFWNTVAHADGETSSSDQQKGGLQQATAIATTAPAFNLVSLASKAGWTGATFFGGHLAQPEGTHVKANDYEGESLVATYYAKAWCRLAGVLPADEPRFSHGVMGPGNAYVDMFFTLPHGGDMSTVEDLFAAGRYAGSFEATNWIAATLNPGDIPQLHDVQGFMLRKSGVWTFVNFTAQIVDSGSGTPRMGVVRVTPTTAFAAGDRVTYGYADGVHLPDAASVAAARPHRRWLVETDPSGHTSGCGYEFPVLREAGNNALFVVP